MYADKVTDSMRFALGETERRRATQAAYNVEHGITPESIRRVDPRRPPLGRGARLLHGRGGRRRTTASSRPEAIWRTRSSGSRVEMKDAAKRLDFERAAELRDRLRGLRKRDLSVRD